MKASEITRVIDQLKEQVIDALAWFYKNSDVGDNPLDLKKPVEYAENDNDVYLVTGIEMMFDKKRPKGYMVFHQCVQDCPSEVATNPLDDLSIDNLTLILKQVEKQSQAFYPDDLTIVY